MKCSFSNYEINNIRKMDEQFINNLINSDEFFSYKLLYEMNFDTYDQLVKSNYLFTIKELKNNQIIGLLTYTDKKILYIIVSEKNQKHFTNIFKNTIDFIFEKLKENTIYLFNNIQNTYLNNTIIKNHFKFDSKKAIMENYIIREYDSYYLTKQMFNEKQIYPNITFKDDISINYIEIEAYIDNTCVATLKSTIHKNDVVINEISSTNTYYEQISKDKIFKKCYQIISEYNYYFLHFNNYYINAFTNSNIKKIILDLNELYTKKDDKKILVNNILNNQYLYTLIEVLSVNKLEYNLLYDYKITKRNNDYSIFTITNTNKEITKYEYFVQDNFLVVKPINILTNEVVRHIKYLEEKTNCLYTILYTYNNETNLKPKYKNQVLR